MPEIGWLGWLLLAVLGFWVLGAHNRVVSLRNDIQRAWAQIDAALRTRRDTLPVLLAALREPLGDAHELLDGVHAALSQAQAAADALRAKPTAAAAAAEFRAREAALDATLARLLVRLERDDALRRRDEVAQALTTLHDAGLRQAFARQLYNDAVDAYNAAVHQWPTRVLVPLFGFSTAGRIDG